MESIDGEPDGEESQAGPVRISQRQPQSCTECTRRKTRCDKLVPCNNCRKRGVPEKCHIEQIIPSKTLSNVSQIQSLRRDLERSNKALAHRVSELERLVRLCLQNQGITDASFLSGIGPIEVDRKIGIASDLEDRNETRDEEAEAAATLEFLAIGRVRDKSPGGLEDTSQWTDTPEWAHRNQTSNPQSTLDSSIMFSIIPTNTANSSSSNSTSFTPSTATPYVPNRTLRSHRIAIQKDIIARLPPKHLGKALVLFDIENVAWMHCCYHGPTLRNESDLFWSELGADDVEVNWSFLALLFGVLSSAVHHLPASMLANAFPNQLIGLWYDACIICLNEADWMRAHSLYAVQCVSIIISAANHLGKGDSYFTLLGSAIRVAQALNLHRLGKDPEANQVASRPHYVVAREVRKRVWWQLFIQDSFHVAFNGACYHPFGGSVPAMKLISTDVPTTDSHTCELLKLAILINRAYTATSHLGPVPYELVLKIDADMQEVRNQAPSWMRDETIALDSSVPAWVDWQRRAYIISSAHKGIVLHRPYLGRAFRGEARYNRSRETCLQLAKKILQVFKGYDLESFRKTWTVLAHVVAACLVLMLDVSQENTLTTHDISMTESLILVQEAISILRSLSDVSIIAKNGVHVLSSLVEGSTHLAGVSGPGGAQYKNAFAGQAERELKRALDIFRRGGGGAQQAEQAAHQINLINQVVTSSTVTSSSSPSSIPTLAQHLVPSPISSTSTQSHAHAQTPGMTSQSKISNAISPTPDVDMSWAASQGPWPVFSPGEANEFEWGSFDFTDTYDENNPLSDMN